MSQSLAPTLRAFIALTTVALMAAPLAAQSPPVPRPRSGVTLAEAVATALRVSPDVAQANAAVDSARAEHAIAAAFPNPVLAATPNSPYQYSATIPLDVTPRRFLRVQGATLGSAATAADRRDVARQTTLTVVRAFYDALLADERLRVAAERRSAVLQLLAGDSARYHSGDIAQHSLARSEIEAARADADVARATADVHRARIALQGAMGLDGADTAFAAIGSLDYVPVTLPADSSDDGLVALARTARPDLQAAEQRTEQSKVAQRSAAALLIPTPELSYVRQRAAPFDNGRYYELGLGFELPSLNTYRGERERAAAGANASVAAQRRVDMQLRRDVTLALADLRLQRSLVERYRSMIVGKMNETLAAEQYAYSHGAASLLEVLDAVRAQQDVRTEYAAALHDYWISVHTLNAAAGTTVADCRPSRGCALPPQ